MFFISVPLFVFLFFCTTGIVIVMGIFSYHSLLTQDKITAETLLFIALCALLLLCICFSSIVLYSKRKKNTLQRINKLVRVNSAAAIKRFGEFGKLGKFFQSFFENILDVSEKRANRIVFLDNALRLMCAAAAEAFIVTNSAGNIKYVSKGFEKINNFGKNLIETQFTDLYPNIQYDDIFTAVSYSHSEHTEQGEKFLFRFFPVCEKKNEVSGLYIVVEKNTLMSAGSKTVKHLYENMTGQDKNETASQDKKAKPKKRILSFFKRQ